MRVYNRVAPLSHRMQKHHIPCWDPWSSFFQSTTALVALLLSYHLGTTFYLIVEVVNVLERWFKELTVVSLTVEVGVVDTRIIRADVLGKFWPFPHIVVLYPGGAEYIVSCLFIISPQYSKQLF